MEKTNKKIENFVINSTLNLSKFKDNLKKNTEQLSDKEGVILQPKTKDKKGKSRKSDTETAEAAATKYIKKLQEEIAMIQAVDDKESARIKTAIEANGKWEKVSQKIKNQLKALAYQKDEAILDKKASEIIKSIEDEIKLIGLKGDAYEIASFKIKLADAKILEGTERYNNLLKEQAKLLKDRNAALFSEEIDAWNKKIDLVYKFGFELETAAKKQELLDKGFSTEQIDIVISKMKQLHEITISSFYGLTKYSKELADQAMDWAKHAESMMQGIFSSIETSLSGLVFRGENLFKNFAKSMLESIAQIMIKLAAMQFMMAAMQFMMAAMGIFGVGGAATTQAAAPIVQASPIAMRSASSELTTMAKSRNIATERTIANSKSSTIIEFGAININSKSDGDPKKMAQEFMAYTQIAIDKKISENNKMMMSRGSPFWRGNA